MPNILPMETRVRIVAALTEGNSQSAAARMFHVTRNAVMDLGLRVGEGCAHLHNALVRGIPAHFIECDETWSFVNRKEARVDPAKHPPEWGDIYTFIGFELTSKLIISF